jgi:hypothetical protein
VPGTSETKARLSWLATPLAEAGDIGLETVRPCGSGGTSATVDVSDALVWGLVIPSSRQLMVPATTTAVTTNAQFFIDRDILTAPQRD